MQLRCLHSLKLQSNGGLFLFHVLPTVICNKGQPQNETYVCKIKIRKELVAKRIALA